MPQTTTNSKSIDFAAIKLLTASETTAVNRLIADELSSDIVLINQIGNYIIDNGGKRLRPMLLLLAAKALGECNQHHLTLAAIVEFIHTATLLHDDVVDESDLRRGKESANVVYGNAASVLVGDYLYSSAFKMMVRVDNMRVMGILSATTASIAEGEVLQLLNCNNPDISEDQYFAVINRKTAILFSAATRLAAVALAADQQTEVALARYGQQLGTAFQLIDDLLDYQASDDLGKNLGDDLTEGKPTLPLIYAMANGTKAQSQLIANAIRKGATDAFADVYHTIVATKALEYTAQCADKSAENAINSLSCLPPSEFKQALIALAKFSVQRDY